MSDLVEMNPGQRKALTHAARDLHTRFRSVFGQGTIEALVFDSFQTWRRGLVDLSPVPRSTRTW